MRSDNDGTHRVWFVTGSSRGFGRALSEAVLARGEHLIATARHPESLDELRERHPKALVLPLDVKDRAGAEAALSRESSGSGGLT
jgi:NAD(P)-dependent dehydrogenase (short-subunit alcohol dehydrogenase family)